MLQKKDKIINIKITRTKTNVKNLMVYDLTLFFLIISDFTVVFNLRKNIL